MSNTTSLDVIKSFQSHPMSKYVIPDDLVIQWFNDSLSLYELEIGDLGYDETLGEFPVQLKGYVIKTIALIMYTNYLTRELSRAEKLNGISGKDIQMTGADATKRVTLADLILELERASNLLDKQKIYKFD